MNDFFFFFAVCLEEPTCMECGRKCSTTEYVWTGDSNSYKGWELWCYCKHFHVESFHKLVKVQKGE